ncbi:MAG: acyl carrier protein [bacterium]
MDYLERIRKVIVRELDVPQERIVLEASFRDDIGASSVQIFDLILAFEDEFGIEIPDEDAVLITTISDAVEYLKKRLG